MTRFAGVALDNYFSTPNFTGLGKTMLEGASLERQGVAEADARRTIADYEADTMRAQAEYKLSHLKNKETMANAALLGEGIEGLGSAIGTAIPEWGKYNFTQGTGTIDRSMVDTDLTKINAYEKANPGLSLNGREYNTFAGWTDPATGVKYD